MSGTADTLSSAQVQWLQEVLGIGDDAFVAPIGADDSIDHASGGAMGGGGSGGGNGAGDEPPDADPPSLTGDAVRQAQILEDLAEVQKLGGAQRLDEPDQTFDPNFDEPGRIPQLQPGPDPVRWDVPLRNIRSTQATVSPNMSDGTPISNVAQTMREEGGYSSDGGPDTVLNDDGTVTTVDHRRLVAADEAGVEEVDPTVHAPDEPLPEDMAERFKLQKEFTDEETGITYPKGSVAETWGEATRFRAANQGKNFPLRGDPKLPAIKDPDPTAGSDSEESEDEAPSLSERAEAAKQEWLASNPEAAKSFYDEFEPADQDGPPSETQEDPATETPPEAPPPQPPSGSSGGAEESGAGASDAAGAEAAEAEGGLGGAAEAGALGGAIAGGMTLYDDLGKVRSGQMSAGDAVLDVGSKTAEVAGLTTVGKLVADAAGGGGDAAAAAAGGGGDAVAAGLGEAAGAGGVIGGVVAGGMALIDDVGKVEDGKMTGGHATVDVAAKTAVGVGAGVAGAVAGAEIGAAVGSIIPGAGTAVGLVAGAVVGGAVGYVGNALMNTETGKEILDAAGNAVDTAIDGVKEAGEAIGDAASNAAGAVSDAANVVVDAAGNAASAVEDAAGSAVDAVGDAASAAASAVGDAASSAVDAIESIL